MYEHNENQLVLPHEFFLPLARKSNKNNRLATLARVIPWSKVEASMPYPSKTPLKAKKQYPNVKGAIKDWKSTGIRWRLINRVPSSK